MVFAADARFGRAGAVHMPRLVALFPGKLNRRQGAADARFLQGLRQLSAGTSNRKRRPKEILWLDQS